MLNNDKIPMINKNNKDKKIALISSLYNEEICKNLYENAIATMLEYNCDFSRDNDFFSVIGAFEIIKLAKDIVKSNKYDALIVTGCIIKGETIHFEQLSQTVINELGSIDFPIGYAVLSVDNMEQAQKRSANDENNHAKRAVIAVLRLLEEIKKLK